MKDPVSFINKMHHDFTSDPKHVLQVVEQSEDVIESKNGTLNAFLGLYTTHMDDANNAVDRFEKQSSSVLTGIPVGLKDNILVQGQLATAASKMLESYKATYDAFVVTKLKEEGAVLMGRTNMDEFAMGSSTEFSAFGPTKNPLNPEHVPGGTSGGSAAAVAMGAVPVALGTDTAGSIRQPASFCGVVGMKPTYGSVSRSGMMAMGSSLDQIGPITKTVTDAELVYNVITGHDPMDATSVTDNVRTNLKKDKAPTVIGVPRSFIESDGVDDDALQVFNKSIDRLKDQGYTIKDIELPLMQHSLAVYHVVLPAEVSSNLARYDGVRFGRHVDAGDLWSNYEATRAGFGEEVRRRIVLGTYVLSEGYYDEYYGKATKLRTAITDEMVDMFTSVDVIATPTTPTEAFKFGEKSDPISMYMADMFTVPANITGVPAISVPCGTGDLGLPLGVQLMAPHFNEHYLFTIGKDLEV